MGSLNVLYLLLGDFAQKCQLKGVFQASGGRFKLKNPATSVEITLNP